MPRFPPLGMCMGTSVLMPLSFLEPSLTPMPQQEEFPPPSSQQGPIQSACSEHVYQFRPPLLYSKPTSAGPTQKTARGKRMACPSLAKSPVVRALIWETQV